MRNLETENEDPLKFLKLALENWCHKDGRPELQLRKVTEIETLKYIQKLGNTSTHGIDGIDTNMIKIAATELYKPITFIINLSLMSQKCPAKWKIATVIPLYKGKQLDKMSPSSYRPISLLPALSKLTERAVQSQIVEHMNLTKQWNQNQHAYRSGHSTTSSLLQLANILFQASDNKQIAAAMSVDETSAFDCVNTDILLKKLNLYKFGNSTSNWISSYMSHRSQFVLIGNKMSDIKPVNQGVPQGSVLGPILFFIIHQ